VVVLEELVVLDVLDTVDAVLLVVLVLVDVEVLVEVVEVVGQSSVPLKIVKLSQSISQAGLVLPLRNVK